MSNYDITVIYACHDRQSIEEGYEFPVQTLRSERLEIIKVYEDDPFCPRKNSLEKIEEASGAYTIMLDEMDSFSEDFLEKMLEAAKDEFAAFSMPSLIGKHVTRSLEYFSILNLNKVINIHTDVCQTVFPMEMHGILFVTEKLKEIYQCFKSVTEKEKRILLSFIEEKRMFKYVGNVTLKYGYPRECDYQYDLRCQMHTWYWEPLREFLLPVLKEEKEKNGIVRRLIQCMALHMLHIRFYANENNRNKHVLEEDEVAEYFRLYEEIMQYVDIDVIISSESNITSSSLKYKMLDIRFKKKNFLWYPNWQCVPSKAYLLCDGKRLGDLGRLQARIYLIDYKNGGLEIDGEVDDLFSTEQCELYVKLNEKKYPVVYNQRYSLTKAFGVSFAKMKTFHVSVPLLEKSVSMLMNFYISINGMEYRLEYGFPGHTSRFTRNSVYSYWCFGEYMSFWTKMGIHIKERNELSILKKEIHQWMELYKRKGKEERNALKLKIINYLVRPYFKNKKIWMFMDKIYKGGDSSEYIYKYAEAQKDGIKKYYLLDKNAADYARMVKEGYKPLIRGSLLHRLVFLNADMVIASNSTVYAFNDYNEKTSQFVRGDANFDVACVQHGMSVQKIAVAQQRLRDNIKLYFCASKYEIKNLSHPVYDYVGYDALHLTGVPRYDGLKDQAEKVILFAPTWRMQSALPVTKNEGVARDYNPNFKETNYYKVYNGLMNDPRMLEAVKKYGYRIKYVLHPIVSPQYDDFEKNEYVEIISAIGDMSYEKLFCESALMVTDFSGVQFDFAYMRKPVVYLHHNDIPQHYEEGTYSYETMSFGEICHTNDELIDVLINYMKNECKMPEVYKKRADDFFEYSDHNNCERIYKIMLEHEMNRQ